MTRKRKSKRKGGELESSGRRDFFLNVFMGTGLVASHLMALGLFLRYLYPTKVTNEQRLFVGLRSEMPPGSAMIYEAPGGRTVNIVRGTKGFIALSDICPHLGCRVHWESQNEEFVCPCHDGHFDANGVATAGPPADTGMSLPQYEIVEEGDMVFLKMAVSS
ncbi:MAG: Rieske (2Fe-2S) protein [Proteobacteria bacterium]|nr:Rieske (2Fe-2S) protein [Pseudomonadota bacterium]